LIMSPTNQPKAGAGRVFGHHGLEHFSAELDPDLVPEALLVVTNFYGGRRLSVYALGKSRRFAYPPDGPLRAFPRGTYERERRGMMGSPQPGGNGPLARPLTARTSIASAQSCDS
jgi:hypothetical protein